MVFLLYCCIATLTAQASDYWTPRIAALGGAGHAGPMLNDSILLNPSFASFLPTYSLSANYMPYKGGTADTPSGPVDFKGRAYNLSIQDGRTELFQAGLSLTQREDALMLHFGVGKSVLKRLGFGLSAKVLRDNVSSGVSVDSTFSFTGIVNEWFQTALIVDNLVESAQGQSYGMYREITLGMKVNVMGIVLAYIDPHYTPSLSGGEKFGHELGLEFVIMKDFFLRLGNFRNTLVPYQDLRGRGYGAGVGWIGPRLSLDYALSRPIAPRGSTAHSFGITVYF